MESPEPQKDARSAPEKSEEPVSLKARFWAEVKFFSKLGVFIVAFITLIWGHFKIPSESMQPTLEVGDHLYVSKYAYGYSKHSLPYLLHKLPLPEGRIFSRLPKRGDVVVFRNPKTLSFMSEKTAIRWTIRLPLLFQNRVCFSWAIIAITPLIVVIQIMAQELSP